MPRKTPKRPAVPATRCTGTAKSTGLQCKNPPIPGGTVCRIHGGRAPQVIAAARRRLLAAEANAELTQLGVTIETTPLEALEAMLYEAAGNVAVLRQLVNSLDLTVEPALQITVDDEDDKTAVWRRGTALAGQTKADTTEAAPHIWVVMYNQERDRLAKLAEACAKLGLDERRVRLAEAQVERFLAATTKAMAAAQMTADQTARFKQTLATTLRSA